MAAQIPAVEQSLGVMKHSPAPKLRQPQQHLNQPAVWPIDADVSQLPGSGGANGGFNPLYQIGGPHSIQLALKLQF